MNLSVALKAADFDAFYTFNEQRLAGVTTAFTELFPGKVLYAVKANPLPQVIRIVSAHGVAGFDIASINEAMLVNSVVPEARSWFMNPAKSRRDVETSFYELGVRNFVVDCEAELHKLFDVLPLHEPEVRLYVRFNTGETTAVFDLNSKFGASPSDTLRLLAMIRAQTRWSTGLAFHPGSQTPVVEPYLDAMRAAAAIIERAPIAPAALDIGGGFPGRYLNVDIQPPALMLARIRELVATSPILQSLELLCEPGRALVHDSMSLFARIILRKDQALYCGAGIYNGLLSAQQFLKLPARAWREDRLIESDGSSEFIIFGPTCDSIDRLAFPYSLPQQLQEGDWLEFQNVGAYSENVRCAFNGFSVEHLISVSDQELG